MFSVSDLRVEIPGLPDPIISTIRYDAKGKRVSEIDVFRFMTGCSARTASSDLDRIKLANPEVYAQSVHFKFPGPGQRDTPVCGAKTLTMLIMAHPSKKVIPYRQKIADVFCRFMSGEKMQRENVAPEEKQFFSKPDEVKDDPMEDIEDVVAVRKMGIEAMKLVMMREERQQNHEMQMAQFEDQRQIRQIESKEANNKRNHDARMLAHRNQAVVDQHKMQHDALTDAMQIIDSIDCPAEVDRYWRRESKRHCASMMMRTSAAAFRHPSEVPAAAPAAPAAPPPTEYAPDPGMIYDTQLLAKKNGIDAHKHARSLGAKLAAAFRELFKTEPMKYDTTVGGRPVSVMAYTAGQVVHLQPTIDLFKHAVAAAAAAAARAAQPPNSSSGSSSRGIGRFFSSA